MLNAKALAYSASIVWGAAVFLITIATLLPVTLAMAIPRLPS